MEAGIRVENWHDPQKKLERPKKKWRAIGRAM
jgi:hypothetical protein